MAFEWANKISSNFRSRSAVRASKNLGVIDLTKKEHQKFRDKKLEIYDSYFENNQYKDLPSWDMALDPLGQHIPVRKRQPRFKFSFAKTLAQRVTAKLVGDSVFPAFKIEGAPDDEAFLKAIIKESKLKSFILEPMRRMVNGGSVFVRFYIVDGSFKLEWFHAKYCYPTFQSSGELESMTIKYVFEDKSEKDSVGNYKKKWFRMDLTQNAEIMFDNPDYSEDGEPQFEVVEQVDHNLGFVQGEWFRTCEQSDSPDGYGFVSDITDFIDEINYSLSQSSQAVGYNQDPQLVMSKMDESELTNLIRSSTKAWNLGIQGEAKFLESNLSGVERASELRDKIRLSIQDVTRIVLLDPDKIVGSAQSAKAMEVLHGPLKDLIDELRLAIGPQLKNLVLKMGLAVLISDRMGIDIPLSLPPGYKPQSLDVDLKWPPIFQQTMEDLQKKVQTVVAAHTGRAISKGTLVRFLAEDFGVEDVEAEIALIDAEPVVNPFGGF